MKRTVRIYPRLNKQETESIIETMRCYATSYNMSVNFLFSSGGSGKKLLHEHVYREVRARCPDLPSALVQTSRDVAAESVKSYRAKAAEAREKRTGQSRRSRKQHREPGKPSMKAKCTMRYNLRCMTLRGSQLTFSTVSKRVKTMISIPSFFIESYPERAFKGGDVGIDRKGRIFVALVFGCPDVPLKEEGGISGLDRGVYNIVTTSEGVRYGAKDARRVKRKHNHVRSELQERGTRSARRRAKALSGREERFVRDQNHCISKSLASDPDVSVYVLEDLSGIGALKRKGASCRTMRVWISGWSYGQLEEFLAYKCERKGIRIVYADPRYTSQTCSVCGTVDKASRKGSRYVCRHCGSTMHADHNAALNIRSRYIITLAPKPGQAPVNAPGSP